MGGGRRIGRARLIAWLFTLAAGVVGVAPAIRSPLRWTGIDAELAALILTLVAIIWYTRFTYEGLSVLREAELLRETRVKNGIARLLQAELGRLDRYIRGRIDEDRTHKVTLRHPVLLSCLERPELFSEELVRKLLGLSGLLSSLERRSGPLTGERKAKWLARAKKTVIAIDQVARTVESECGAGLVFGRSVKWPDRGELPPSPFRAEPEAD